MTPDELRRLDNDLCIIFEKGIKPVKASKFYYFKHPMAKEMSRLEISHNDIGKIDRGVWRKYNPYNPYVEQETKTADTKIESLDDLFDDLDESAEGEGSGGTNKNPFEVENVKKDNQDDTLSYDIQKELEAKFDELFGALEDDNNI